MLKSKFCAKLLIFFDYKAFFLYFRILIEEWSKDRSCFPSDKCGRFYSTAMLFQFNKNEITIEDEMPRISIAMYPQNEE
ncbi:hypothetical protein BWX39_00160 [Prevotella intermedia ATCC 25611 = DSM 20706]|nr:hypothetical protein BWX39_00160 [Prevotella intermedia ATCC 25611 = DSM 20706]